MELTYELYIAAPTEQVWAILVSPEEVKKVFYGSVIESTFQVGDLMQYVGPGTDGDRTVHLYGNVLQYEPNHVFTFTHNVGKAYATAAEDKESRVSFQVEPCEGGTKLTLIHDEWSTDDPSYEASIKSWPPILSAVKTLAETGKAVTFG